MLNSEQKKDILEQPKAITPQELDLYLSGKLSPSEARAIEHKLHSSGFESDAHDGFNTYAKDVGAVQISQEYGKPANTGWMWVGAFAVIGLLGFGIVYLNSDADTSTAKQNTVKLSKPADGVNKTLTHTDSKPLENQTTPAEEEVIIAHTETAPETDESLLIADQITDQQAFSPEVEKEIMVLNPIDNKKPKLYYESSAAELATPAGRIRHYKNYKLVDQGIGIDQSLLEPVLQGTPAFAERIVVNPKYPEWVPADSVYKASINEAIDWIIEDDLTLAKMRFKRLVENNPDDLTACFYLGYVLFLKEDYKDALHYLNQAQRHLIQTYDHDSRFIEIKCQLALGEDDKAKKEAEYLKNAESFYAERAMALVK